MVVSQPLCRLLDGEFDEDTREAETAVMQLLEATEPAQRKRAADGSWRPPQGSTPGAPHAPWQAILRLHTLYSTPSPPPMSLIRHPQASFCALGCIKLPASRAVVVLPPLMLAAVLHLTCMSVQTRRVIELWVGIAHGLSPSCWLSNALTLSYAWQVIKRLLVSLCGSENELGQAEAQACRALLALAAAALDSRYMRFRSDITQQSSEKVLQRQNVIALLLQTHRPQGKSHPQS